MSEAMETNGHGAPAPSPMEQDNYYDSSPNNNAGRRHTQFLDLTNGEGGERHAHYEDDDDMEGLTGVPSGGNSTSGSLSSLRVDPNTPGRVVETGQEHTGRWTKEEHEAFLSALRMYGKEWKKVAAKVKTRTVVQTRTHAQKYFQKLQKAMESGKEDVTHVEMGVASEAKKATTQKKKRVTPSIAAKPARQSSVTSAAHLISNLSSNPAVAAAAVATVDSPQPAYSAPPPSIHSQPQQPTNTLGHLSAPHGFSSSTEPTFRHAFPPGGSFSTSTAPGERLPPGAMKIIAPEHDAASRRGKFPEPSPAACGKRKLAELAAARMLAGVAAGGGVVTSSNVDRSGQPFLSSTANGNGDEDGEETPPPQPEPNQNRSVDLGNIPVLPIVGKGNNLNGESSNEFRKPAGLSLQIVNPETLGVSHNHSKRRRGEDGQGSPVTPWEGALKALVSESKNKGQQRIDEDGLKFSEAAEERSSYPHPVCGPGALYGRSRLHAAVCNMDYDSVQYELAAIDDPGRMQKRDEAGFCPMHSACALSMTNPQNSAVALKLVRLMLSMGADVGMTDSKGNTPLHWASRCGEASIVELLIAKSCLLDARNERGETPLHWAMRVGRLGINVTAILLENGARPFILNYEFKRPIDVTADGFDDEEGSVVELKKLVGQRKRLSKEQRKVLKDAAEERRDARSNLLKQSMQSRTLVLHHPECLEHIPKSSSDWEVPGRVTTIMGRLLALKDGPDTTAGIMDHEVAVSQEFDRAKLDLLSRVHSTEYLSFVNELSKDLERQQKAMNGDSATVEEDSGKPGTITPPVVPFTPMVQRSMIRLADSSIKQGQHSDTSFSAGSLRAARRAAGAVQHAVDCVLVGRNRNAFCVVRPPGHHAGINGLLDGGESCGFCIFNNVAAGAMHAISDERLLCERCAIVDIDVHHGNGTEEIVRKCHDPSKLFFFSIHLYDNDKKGKRETKSFQYKFYPGTGDEDDVALNIINVPITPLWKEKEQGAGAQAAVNTHNTRQKARKRNLDRDSMDDSSEAGTPKASDAENEPSTVKNPPAEGSPQAPNNTLPGGTNAGRMVYRQAIQNRLLPALRAFNPDLILISTGFDASKGDVGNAKHEHGGKEKMGLDLEPEDYAWTTRKILEIADICCQGRVVSVLEGGYGRTPQSGDDKKPQPLDKNVLSECAIRHLHALIDPYDVENRFGSPHTL